MHSTRRRRPGAWLAGVGAGTLAGLVLLTGCTIDHSTPGAHSGASWNAPSSSPSASADSSAPISVAAPSNGATGQPTSTELRVRTANGANPAATTVTLTDSDGKQVPGAFRVDGSSWVPDHELAYNTRYSATVAATGTDGKTVSSKSTFTTRKKPADTVGMHTFLADDQVVGVAAPLVVTFDQAIPLERRADVEKRLFVTATPAQVGSWYWYSGTEVHYRPKEQWRTGTHITLRAALGGVPLGDDTYGRADTTLGVDVVDHALAISIDDATKTLTVTRDGVVVRTMPASLGKATTPSSSGNMVVMTRETQAIFDSSTYGVPVDSPEGYKETVLFPLRLTWGGQYIHAAPWSVADQGKNNVSHGCTNISTENAQWLYNETHVGDPVSVRNTGRDLTWGDGWSDWDRDWTGFLQGSALDSASGGYDYSAPGTLA